MPKLKSALWTIACIVFIVSVAVAVRQWRVATDQTAEAGRLAAENHGLRAKLEETARERDSLRESLAVGRPAPPGEHERDQPDKDALAQAAADAQTIRQLNENLATATSTVNRLEERVAQLEGELKTVAEENERRAQSQQDLGEKIGGLNRIIAAMEREAKSRNDRLLQLELANKRLREENTAASRKSVEATNMASELQELFRRREVYLSGILSRYREVTDLFRSFSQTLENRSRQEGGGGSSAELSRIQNSISLAEEDLRQLSSLNAQAMQLQRKVFGR